MIGQGHGHMSDRLALANAIQDAGIERDKAERLATVIFNAIHDNVATKADVQASEASVRSQLQSPSRRRCVARLRRSAPRLSRRSPGWTRRLPSWMRR